MARKTGNGSQPQDGMTAKDFGVVFDRFQSTVSRYDCGRFCAPLNNGEPVCCSTQNAVPVVHKVEKSERVEKEKQVPLFERTGASALPALSLLDDPPPRHGGLLTLLRFMRARGMLNAKYATFSGSILDSIVM